MKCIWNQYAWQYGFVGYTPPQQGSQADNRSTTYHREESRRYESSSTQVIHPSAVIFLVDLKKTLFSIVNFLLYASCFLNQLELQGGGPPPSSMFRNEGGFARPDMMSIRPTYDPYLENLKSPLIKDESDGKTLRLRFIY